MRFVGMLVLAWSFALAAGADPARGGTVPAGFADSVAISGLTDPTAVRFASDGRVFVAEKSGLIKVFDSVSDPTATVFADLRTNVHNYWDRGLLGLALDPSFPSKPYVYVLYTYDHVLGSTAPAPRWGTVGGTSDSCPTPPGPTADGCVVSGRLSRLQANGNVMTGAENVLIEDWCQQFPGHSVGSIAFGSDGALYVTGGEGANFDPGADYGQKGNPVNPCGDPPGGIGATLTPPTAEGGALRAQDLRTSGDPTGLSGSLLRVNPDTGAALPDNPLAASADPNARRIVAHGFRNPFRMAIRPGTSDVWIGDVGWATSDEIDRVPNPTAGVLNFGWPCYEGVGRVPDYDNANLNICENLYAQPAAATAPLFSYNQPAKVAPGESCPAGASAVSGVAFYPNGPYPPEYDGALFFADYMRNCIWAMRRGADNLPNPSTITTFVAAAANPVDLQVSPAGELYYVDLNGGTVHRVRFAAAGNNAPPGSALGTAPPVIVGLGDSYSSGEANPLFDAGTDIRADKCHRSFLSWQRLIGVSPGDQFACSGAKVQDLTSGQRAVAPDNVGQFERLRQRAKVKNIDWVVMTVGGNDLGFARALRECVDPQTACLQQNEQFLKLQLNSLEPRLKAAYQQASVAAGGARVAVVGYPYLFPKATLKYTNCSWMSRGEKVRVRRAQDLFEATLKRAATEAGATFVSVLDSLRGRELCTPHSWMYPIASAAGGVGTDQQQAHPTACGQAAIARKVISALGLKRTIYGCDTSKDLRVVILGDTRADGLSAGLRVVASHAAPRQRLRNVNVPLTTIFHPTPLSVTSVHVYDRAHFSADVNQSGSASLDADRIWYSPAGRSIRKIAACNLRYGCPPPARGVPTRLGAVRLLNVKGAPPTRPRRFVHRKSEIATDVEFVGVSWARWGQRKAIGEARMAMCRRAPCPGGHDAVALAASSLILCPIRGQARMVGYYHSLRYRRTKGNSSETFTIPQDDDVLGACRTLVRH